MSEFRTYIHTTRVEARPYEVGEYLKEVNISAIDKMEGSPRQGDMIARSPYDHDERWLISEAAFNEGDYREETPSITSVQ